MLFAHLVECETSLRPDHQQLSQTIWDTGKIQVSDTLATRIPTNKTGLKAHSGHQLRATKAFDCPDIDRLWNGLSSPSAIKRLCVRISSLSHISSKVSRSGLVFEGQFARRSQEQWWLCLHVICVSMNFALLFSFAPSIYGTAEARYTTSHWMSHITVACRLLVKIKLSETAV